MNAVRLSPVHRAIAALQPDWGEFNDMLIALQFDHNDSQRMAVLGIADLSCLPRYGIKGPGCVDWLLAQGMVMPDVNSWALLAGGGLIARLGKTEFLLEDSFGGNMVQSLQTQLADRPPGVYPVLRQDAALVLSGTIVHQLLRQTCSFNFMTVAVASHPLVLTTMVGVAVTILPQMTTDGLIYRIWCDGTYGEYLWGTLLEIATELNGGAVGLNHLKLEGKSQ